MAIDCYFVPEGIQHTAFLLTLWGLLPQVFISISVLANTSNVTENTATTSAISVAPSVIFSTTESSTNSSSNFTTVEELPQFLQDILQNINNNSNVNINSISARERRQLFTPLEELVITPVRRIWPQMQQATKTFRYQFIPSMSEKLNQMGSEVVQVMRNKVFPSVKEAIVDISNDAVPVINSGIDMASVGIERSSDVITQISKSGAKSISLRLLGPRRYRKLNNFVNNMTNRVNNTVNSFTNTLVDMVEKTNTNNPSDSRSDINKYYFDYYTGEVYGAPYFISDDHVDLTDQTKTDSNDRSDDGISTVIKNTAYILSANILGKNLTHAVAPLARSVGRTVSKNLPNFSFNDGDRTVGNLLSGGNSIADERQDKARKCTTPAKEDGLCKDLGDCPDLILDLGNLRRSVCFKDIFIPGVCCPKSGIRTVEEPTTRTPLLPTRRPLIGGRPTDERNPIARPPVSQHPNALYRCGVTRTPEQRIVGGESSPRGKWPWMAAIFLHGPKKTEFWCGASLVSAKFVLTAAHCTKDPNGKTFNPRQFTVRLGDYDIFSKQDDHLVQPETYRVESITPHPDFKARGFYNDVALLKLKEEVRFNDYIVPICLPPPAMAAEPLDSLVNQKPTVIGFGSTHYDGEESPTLREAKLPIWTNKECDDAYLQPITDIFLCAGYKEGGTDACQGDSGGPLLLYVSSRQWVQVGVVSFGNRCAEPGYPGVYTRLTQFMPWIHKNMIKLN